MRARLLYTTLLLFGIAVMTLFQSCRNHYDVEKQYYGEMTFSKTIKLQLDTLLHSQIIEFIPVGESSYVLTDGACIYKTDSTGSIVKRINKQGHGKEEYLKISKLFSNGHNIYAWCAMSVCLYKYDMDLNFIDKYQGLSHAIAKFVVTDTDTAYFLLSGGFDETIGVLPLKQNAPSSYDGCYDNEDKALLFNGISGGIAIFENHIKYVKPSHMEVCMVGNDDTWIFEDKDFSVKPTYGNLVDWTDSDILNYILSNSTCSGLYSEDNNLWLITETGSILQNEDETLSYASRYLNIHKINKLGEIISSRMYNYPINAVNYVVYKKHLHLLCIEGESYIIKQHVL